MSDQDKAPDADDGLPRMTLGEHLEELRRRLLYAIIGLVVAMVATLAFGKFLLEALQWPYMETMRQVGMAPQLRVPEVTGAFGIYLRVTFYAGLVLASPWIFYQLWMFVAAGLYPRERRYVTYAVPFSALLFVCGAAFFLAVVAMPALKFFLTFPKQIDWAGIEPLIMLDDYIGFMTSMILLFGLVFQVPLVVLILAKTGLVELRTLRKFRRHVILAMFVLAAVFAPPDVFSQVAMALPMWALYELGLVLAWLLIYRKRPADHSAAGGEA
jgi:sec-independent protein translocase protein TatC